MSRLRRNKYGGAAEGASVQRRPMTPGKRALSDSLVSPVQRKESADVPVVAVDRDAGEGAGAWDASDFAEAAGLDWLISAPAVQRKGDGASAVDVHAEAAAGVAGASTALPHADRIQESFGRHDVSHVQAHVGGGAATAAQALGAEAYATGDHVAFAESPSLHTAAHEAAHVVQQRGGVQLQGGVGVAGDRYEQQADEVADAVVRGASAERLLDGLGQGHPSSGIQRRAAGDAQNEPAGDHPDPLGIRRRTAQEFGYPIPPDVVDGMIRDTAAIHLFVEHQMKNGWTTDGTTFIYWSDAEFVRGVVPHLSRFDQDPITREPIEKSDERLMQEARALAADNVAVCLINSDFTIHINAGAGDHSVRTILHEAMHQQMRLESVGFGKRLAEGFAEFLSEIVFRQHGMTFRPHGPYAEDYRFVAYLAELFGEETLIRCALRDGIEPIRAECFKYLNNPETDWRDLETSMREADYGKARDLLSRFTSLRAMHRPADEAAEAADSAFWAEADQMERDLSAKHRRTTWPVREGPIRARIIGLTGGDAHAVMTLSKGGMDGVREGWLLEFGAESEFPGEMHAVTVVRDHQCEAFVPRSADTLAAEPNHDVRLREP